MAITETVTGTKWEKKADTPEDAKRLSEEFGRGLQQFGAEDFHRKFLEDLSTGFDRMRTPDGAETMVRRDRVDTMLAQGYSGSGAPRMTMPDVPWERKPVGPGRHRYRVVNGRVEEV